MREITVTNDDSTRTSLGYVKDLKITDVLKSKPFTLSAEMIPPRNGEEVVKTMKKLNKVVGSGVDFLSVTKGAGGSLRGGSLPIAQTIKDNFSKPCIAHFTCRDLSPKDIENQLVDHHYFGIRNILALRGDPPMGETDWIAPEDGYDYAYQLMQQIKRLNRGEFLQRKGYATGEREPTDFCIGAAVYPEHPDKQERIEFSRIKFEEGAEYGMTQMIFDPDYYGQFCSDLAALNIKAPIIPGLRILRSQAQAHVMKTRFGCSVPDWYMKQLPATHEKGQFEESVIEPFIELVDRMKKLGAPGVHIFVLTDIELCQLAMAQLKDSY
ncbi:MAG: methylenetetrahydrofolate reductase [Bdellovibrionales bacterium]|nr:methylenetetrahydrofolate reductase [Bdellovibrionales bacterium]